MNSTDYLRLCLSGGIAIGVATTLSEKASAQSNSLAQAAAGKDASTDERAAELRKRMDSLPAGSPERSTLAAELLELRHADKPLPTTAPTAKAGKAASLPAWAVEQITRLRLQTIRREVAQREREVAAAKEPITRRANATRRGEIATPGTIDSYYGDELKAAEQRLADARKRLRDAEISMPALLEHVAAEYPNGVVQCPACHGTGEVSGDGTYVPSVTLDSGRSIGGVTVADRHKCSACDGLGLVERDAGYDRAIAAVTPAQIAQKRAAMEQRWESYLNTLTDKAKMNDPMPVFAGEDARFVNELSGSPSTQIQKVRAKLASVKHLTDTQVAELIVEDGNSVDKPAARMSPTQLFGGH